MLLSNSFGDLLRVFGEGASRRYSNFQIPGNLAGRRKLSYPNKIPTLPVAFRLPAPAGIFIKPYPGCLQVLINGKPHL